MPNEQKSGWLSSPSNWLSLTAVAISALTFFLVNANPGKIQVTPPDRVGVALYKGYLSLAAPLTFTNTGAPRTVRHVTSVTAEIATGTSGDIKLIGMYWLFQRAFVGRREHLAKYPKLEEEGVQDPDSIDY